VGGDRFDLCVLDVAFEIVLDFGEAVVDVPFGALGEHLDVAVREVADEAGEAVPCGDAMGREAKADALDLTAENDMSCRLFHVGRPFPVDYSSSVVMLGP